MRKFTPSELALIAKSARSTIINMTTKAGSGHPGGSLSSIDLLTVLYLERLMRTAEPIIISNGHVAPAVYAILAEIGLLDKTEVTAKFRQAGEIFEGHVSRAVKGIWYGTGPLGTGLGAAVGMAIAKKRAGDRDFVFCLVGDGEMNEGMIYESLNLAIKERLDNLVVIVDLNGVQLSGKTTDILPLNLKKILAALGLYTIEVDGHNHTKISEAIRKATAKIPNTPRVILGKTIMGKGVPFMEKLGRQRSSVWHGRAPSAAEATLALGTLNLTDKERQLLTRLRLKTKNPAPQFPDIYPKKPLKKSPVSFYPAGQNVACRDAYGKTLTALAEQNQKQILALSADLVESIRLNQIKDKLPNQFVECGIAEQAMLSVAGGMSILRKVPFVSTFGVFMTSRAKDQARVNDLNQTNVKMVATHCGLSVGEDGPTHQAIDDIASVSGFFHTLTIEPADANQTIHLTRFAADHHGNIYLRMGRHALPIIEDATGKPFFGSQYTYTPGQTDILRQGQAKILIVTAGALAHQAIAAHTWLEKSHSEFRPTVLLATSPTVFDQKFFDLAQSAELIITIEDHEPTGGLGGHVATELMRRGITPKKFHTLGVNAYQTSGKAEALYEKCGLTADHLIKLIEQNSL